MSGYIGSQPADSFLSISSQQITGNGGATYSLSSSVTSPEDVAVFVNNVRQNPNTYSVSNNQITLGGTISSSDSCYVIFLGKTLATVNPPSGSVGLTQLSATGTKNNTTFLRGDNTFATPSGGVNTPYFFAYRNATLSISHASYTKIVFDAEDLDSGSGFNVSTGEFTVPENGKYFFEYSIFSTADADTNSVRMFSYGQRTRGVTDTKWGNGALDFRANYGRAGSLSGSIILDCETSDTVKIYLYHQTVNSGNVSIKNGSDRPTYFLGYKLIE
jgi:hypothetical protein